MVKAKFAVSSRRRRRKTMKFVKGQVGGRSKLLRTAKDAQRRALVSNFRDRKRKKSEYRSLWIVRINAACKLEGMSYSRLISALKAANVILNRKMIAEIALSDLQGFKALVAKVKK
jgi:large subunit ribosomal protein L20